MSCTVRCAVAKELNDLNKRGTQCSFYPLTNRQMSTYFISKQQITTVVMLSLVAFACCHALRRIMTRHSVALVCSDFITFNILCILFVTSFLIGWIVFMHVILFSMSLHLIFFLFQFQWNDIILQG